VPNVRHDVPACPKAKPQVSEIENGASEAWRRDACWHKVPAILDFLAL